MRLVMLSAPPVDKHGWGRYTRELIRALTPHGVQITLITARNAPPRADLGDLVLAAYARILPSITPPVRLGALRMLACAPVIRRYSRRVDLLHVTAEPYTLAASGVSRPLIVTAHGTYLPQTAVRPPWGALYGRQYRRAHVLCVSHYTERAVLAAVPGARTTVIPNGVDSVRFENSPEALPAKRRPTILIVGQVKARKGHHLLAAALPLIRARQPEAEIVVIGDTSDTAYVHGIQRDLAANGLGEAVHWLGRAPESTLRGWYAAADVFALPALTAESGFEGFGLVYLEASAAGLPVIGTRDCGAEDAIRDGQTGYLIPQNDPPALAEAILRLLDDPALRAQMGQTGCAFAAEHTWDRIAARVLAAYRSG